MCKVFIMPSIKDDKREKAKEFVKEVTKEISKNIDRDGVGYAAITRDGKIFGEKWLNPEDAWKLHSKPAPTQPSEAEMYLNQALADALEGFAIKKEEKNIYERFGEVTKENADNTVAIMVHARKTTVGETCIENTHPFVEYDKNWNDTAIIHNGTIKNHYDFEKKYSKCDSEVILHKYIKDVVSYVPENVKNLASSFVGSYAVGVLTSVFDKELERDVPILDIFKSNKDLWCAYVEELETPVFCTTSYSLTSAAKTCNLTLTDTFKVKDGVFIRLDAETAERLESFTFTPSREFNTSNTYGGSTSRNSKSKDDVDTEKVKRLFENHNSDLFGEYYEIGELTEKEKEALSALEATGDPNIRALHLVKKCVGADI